MGGPYKYLSAKTKSFSKNQGGVKTAVGSELSLVSGNYHEVFGPVAMEMASKSAMFLATLF
jgi:hypothetical protein